MSAQTYQMLDPTGELAAERRPRRAPPPSLDGATIGLMSISKERSREFPDRWTALLTARRLNIARSRIRPQRARRPSGGAGKRRALPASCGMSRD